VTLRTKTLSIVGVAIAGLLAVIYLVSNLILVRSYHRIEQQDAMEGAERLHEAVMDAPSRVAATLRNWTDSDGAYRYLSFGDVSFLRNFQAPSLKDARVSFVLIAGRDGLSRYEAAYDAKSGRITVLPGNCRKFMLSAIGRFAGLSRCGIVVCPDGPVMIASRPILKPGSGRDPCGTVIIGRALDDIAVRGLSEVVHAPVSVSRLGGPSANSDSEAVGAVLSRGTEPVVRVVDSHWIAAYVPISDVYGRPALVVRGMYPRDVYRNGTISLKALVLSLICVGLMFSVVAIGVIEQLVLKRVTALSRAVTGVSATGNPEGRVPALGGDEIGELSDNINGMLEALEASQRAVQKSQRRLSRIVETNADGIIIVDLEGRITFANAAAETLFGLPRTELTHRTCDDPNWHLSTPDGLNVSYTDLPFNLVIESGMPVFRVEHSMVRADGCHIVLSTNAAPLRDAEGAITGVVASLTDITERKALEERLSYQAFHDPLTNLPNRVLFQDRLSRALTRCARLGKRVAVVFIDLDNFKLINDSLGHAMGDQLLVVVAERLQRCLRASDTAARFGGDEFVLLIEDVKDESDAALVAERVLELFRDPLLLATREVFISVTMGIAMGSSANDDPAELLRNADAAAYAAKSRGRGGFRLFEKRMNVHALHRLEMENDLRRAVERNELAVYYQPIVSLSTGAFEGLEALVRWKHPRRGLISPLDFVPMAEETGLIVSIGRHVLNEACRQMEEWRKRYPVASTMYVGVNLSARQFQQPALIAEVAGALHTSGLPASALALEITESVIMEESQFTNNALKALKDLGVRLAIDDFGTGYSSLSYLRRFPLDYLKIDRSFVDGLCRVVDDGLIVSSTISLAHALGLTVIAEGAESVDQVRELFRLGCDNAQGYYFHPALPAEEVDVTLSCLTTSLTQDIERHLRSIGTSA
jgi:diguanylate cyclase (GGDEF)-like protein/PAS domain S-box-containing protein